MRRWPKRRCSSIRSRAHCSATWADASDSLKILYTDKNGFALWWKKIESDEKYHWPRLLQQAVVTLTVEQLNWLLEGYDIWTQLHRMIKFAHVS